MNLFTKENARYNIILSKAHLQMIDKQTNYTHTYIYTFKIPF